MNKEALRDDDVFFKMKDEYGGNVMGTTRSFYLISNKNMTVEFIKERLQSANNRYVKKAVIAHSEDAKWFMFFETNMCDGYCASTDDTELLSNLFSSDVVAFSIFDSDVLFVSYTDYFAQISINVAKPNDDNYEEYDSDLYKLDFPKFLVPFCKSDKRQKLYDIWESQDYDDADDRLDGISDLIDACLMYDYDDEIPGYELIYASKENI